MDRAHALDTPVGWPAGLADRLRRRGSALECSLVFMPDYEHLPARASLGQFLRLSGDPDVVVVHTGGVYTRRVILPDTRQIRRLRDDIGRRLGRHVFAGYRLLRPVVRLAGRPVTPYRGRADLERFLVDARAAWPHAAIVVLAPLRRSRARLEQRRLEARRRRCSACGTNGRSGLHRPLRPRPDIRDGVALRQRLQPQRGRVRARRRAAVRMDRREPPFRRRRLTQPQRHHGAAMVGRPEARGGAVGRVVADHRGRRAPAALPFVKTWSMRWSNGAGGGSLIVSVLKQHEKPGPRRGTDSHVSFSPAEVNFL